MRNRKNSYLLVLISLAFLGIASCSNEKIDKSYKKESKAQKEKLKQLSIVHADVIERFHLVEDNQDCMSRKCKRCVESASNVKIEKMQELLKKTSKEDGFEKKVGKMLKLVEDLEEIHAKLLTRCCRICAR